MCKHEVHLWENNRVRTFSSFDFEYPWFWITVTYLAKLETVSVKVIMQSYDIYLSISSHNQCYQMEHSTMTTVRKRKKSCADNAKVEKVYSGRQHVLQPTCGWQFTAVISRCSTNGWIWGPSLCRWSTEVRDPPWGWNRRQTSSRMGIN